MFKKGQSGNPAGRPKGSRNKLTGEILEILADDWTLHGEEAIRQAREKDPMGYVRAMVSLLPRELNFTRPLEDLTDDELGSVADYLRSRIRTKPSGEGDRDSSGTESVKALPTVQ